MNLQALAELIRVTRKSKSLNQAQVAAWAGINRTTLSKLESGALAEIGYAKVERVLSVLGLSIEVVPTESQRPTLDDLVAEQARRSR